MKQKTLNANVRNGLKKVALCATAATVAAVVINNPALAAANDLFASGKDAVKATAGDGSGVETAMLSFSAIASAVLGITTRNWFAAVGGFAGGMIFWEVIKPLVGLA